MFSENGKAESMYIDVLTEEECSRVRAAVYDLRKYWAQDRLGAASYKILPFRVDSVGRFLYRAKARKLNPMLRERLGWLYEKLADRLADALGAPTCYPDKFALPGFHIFLEPIGQKSIHFDLQWRHFNWGSAGRVDLQRPLSFTLPVALPKHGAGLNLWDLRYEEVKGCPDGERLRLQHARKKSFVPYKLGKAVCHSGLQLHQMAASQNFQPGDERITLQGHCVMRDGAWQIYW